MSFIPEHKIDEVRDAANIVEVISSYVNLQQAGRIFKGLCPFHAEKTPSFTVNPERRIFHCFGCGVGGNVFRFLMLQKSIAFPEAVKELADRYGIELPNTGAGNPVQDRGEKAALYKVINLAAEFFQSELASASGRAARSYLLGRGIGPEIARTFKIGWAPAGWDGLAKHLRSKGAPDPLIQKAGLVRPRKNGRGCYDTFRSRIITPIFDPDGKTIAFGGRLIDTAEGQPKYINSPETPVYSKGRILYGLERSRPFMRDEKFVFIVEGYFDFLSLYAHGVKNAVATLGTALTAAHLRLLKGYVQHAYLMFDADEAGRSAAARSLPLFVSMDLEAKVLTLPDGHDPDTFVRQFGPEALKESLDGAESLLNFYIDRTVERYPDTLAGKSRAVQDVLDVINQVDGQTHRELLRKALAERLGISEESLILSERRQEKRDDQPDARASGIVEGLSADFEKEVVRLVLLHPETAAEIFSASLEEKFTDPLLGRVFNCMAGLFRQSGAVDADRLVEKLPSEEADLVSKMALSDDGLQDVDVQEIVLEYIRKFADREQKMKVLELSRRIRQAQESGDFSAAQLLLKEKIQLHKQLNQ